MHLLSPVLALPLLLSVPAQAEDPWLAQARRGTQANQDGRPFLLRVDPGDLADTWWRRDDALVRLLEDFDLALSTLRPARPQPGREPQWLVLDATGSQVAAGRGLPRGEEIHGALTSTGYHPLADRRDSFLAEHPDQGEALESRLFTALGLMRARFLELAGEGKASAPEPGGAGPSRPGKLFPNPSKLVAPSATPVSPANPRPVSPARTAASARLRESAPARPPMAPAVPLVAVDPRVQGDLADGLYRETAETLEQLVQLPDWWRMPRLERFCSILEGWDAGASPRMRGLLAGMKVGVLEAWKRSPQGSGVDLGLLWTQLERLSQPADSPVLPALEVSPGRLGTDRTQLDRMLRGPLDRGDWKGVLAFIEGLSLAPPRPLSPSRWRDYRELQARVAQLQALAWGKLGRWKEAVAALDEARRWAGDGWPAVVAASRRAFPEGASAPAAEFQLILDLPAEPVPLMPAPVNPVRMLMVRPGPGAHGWGGLRQAPELAPWDSSELTWALASRAERADLDRRGLGQANWVALWGPDTVLASGTALPEPAALAQALAGAGSTRLEELGAFLGHDPEHLDARRDRYLLLRPRMPHPTLEPLLAEDTALGWLSPEWRPAGAWRPDPLLWGPQAERLEPDLVAALHRWPSSARFWKVWVGWNAIRSRPRSVYGFAQSLPVFGAEAGWLAALPLEAHQAVIRELLEAGRLEPLQHWCQSAWEQWRAQGGLAADQEKLEAVYRGLREALTGLGLKSAVAELEQQRQKVRVSGPAR